jgi:hypothetical protein
VDMLKALYRDFMKPSTILPGYYHILGAKRKGSITPA